MAYRSDPDDKIPVSSFSLGDWLAASFALALGAAVFWFVAFLAFWAVGMPGPLLWMGSGNVPSDILTTAVTIGPALFFINLFGAFTVTAFFAALRKLRQR